MGLWKDLYGKTEDAVKAIQDKIKEPFRKGALKSRYKDALRGEELAITEINEKIEAILSTFEKPDLDGLMKLESEIDQHKFQIEALKRAYLKVFDKELKSAVDEED